MTTNWKILRGLASALFLGIVLAGCATGPNNPPPELVKRIESARTRSDHAALVATYEQEAAAARNKAEEHRKMAVIYKGRAVSQKGGLSMSSHCNSIVSLYENMATEYDGLAGDHRKLADGAPL